MDEARLEEGLRAIEEEEKTYEKALRDQHKSEAAHRISQAVKEFVESVREGWRLGGLDGYIHYFCREAVSFLDYFPESSSLIFLDEPLRLKEKSETVELEFRESMSHRLENGYMLPGQTGLLYPAAQVMARLQRNTTVMLTGLDQKLPGMKVAGKFGFTVKNVSSYQNSFEMLIKDLTRWKKEGWRVVLLSASRTRASRLASDLREYELRAFCPDQEKEIPNVLPGQILVVHGNLHRGFEYPLIKFVFITEGDMFGVEKKEAEAEKNQLSGPGNPQLLRAFRRRLRGSRGAWTWNLPRNREGRAG